MSVVGPIAAKKLQGRECSEVFSLQKTASSFDQVVHADGYQHSPNGIYGMSAAQTDLLRLDVGRPDHLGPFLGFVGDELAEVGGRAGKHRRRPRRQAAP